MSVESDVRADVLRLAAELETVAAGQAQIVGVVRELTDHVVEQEKLVRRLAEVVLGAAEPADVSLQDQHDSWKGRLSERRRSRRASV